MNIKRNNHFIKTDQKIKDTLLQLIEEDKPLTISEICKRAEINRTTFYLHYSDIVELIGSVQTEIFKGLQGRYLEKKDQVSLMSLLSYEMYAQYVQENQQFYKYYFKMNTKFPLNDGFEDLWDTILVPYFREYGIYNEEIMKLRFVCFQAGFTIATRNWVENGCKISYLEFANKLI